MSLAVPTPQIQSNFQENLYYHAKGLKDDSIEQADKAFHELIANSDLAEDIEWIFKSYKQLAKISYQQQRWEQVLQYIGILVGFLSKLSGNYAEDSINKLLLRYSASKDTAFVSEMYDVIVSSLEDSCVSGMSAHRLWLKINMNRLNNLLENGVLDKCPSIILAIKEKLETVSELTKNSYVLDIIAAEIEYVMRKNTDVNLLQLIYQRSLQVKPAITHPRVMGIIRECGAIIQFYKNNYERARVEFYECFKHYDEAGSSSKKKVLKYLSLCSMLSDNEVNPFESQETQAYAQLPEYQNLICLAQSYEDVDIEQFLSVVESMNTSGDSLSVDPIFEHSVPHILHNLKMKILLKYLKAYKTLSFDYAVRKLFLADEDELERLLMNIANCGSDSHIRVDFCDKIIEIEDDNMLFPASLNPHIVNDNFRVLESVQFQLPCFSPETNDTQMDIDNVLEEGTGSTYDIRNKLFFDSRKSQEWLLWMRSAIPAKARQVVSQKDQVFSEQQDATVEKQDDRFEDKESEENTNTGILGSSMAHSHDAADEDDDDDDVDKLGLLQTWTQLLLDSFRGI